MDPNPNSITRLIDFRKTGKTSTSLLPVRGGSRARRVVPSWRGRRTVDPGTPAGGPATPVWSTVFSTDLAGTSFGPGHVGTTRESRDGRGQSLSTEGSSAPSCRVESGLQCPFPKSRSGVPSQEPRTHSFLSPAQTSRVTFVQIIPFRHFLIDQASGSSYKDILLLAQVGSTLRTYIPLYTRRCSQTLFPH